MDPMSVGEVAAALRGRGIPTSLAGLDPGAVVTAVTVDSREVTPGSLFVALPGSRTDGHDHVAAAVEAGATAALVARPVGAGHLLVADPLGALAALAAAVRDQLTDTRVIAVTGSSGKTTTKDLLATVLERHAPTVAPPGSFNNDLGTPLTVLRAQSGTRYLVLEMGARRPGDIARLASWARPQVGVVLGVGSAHLGVFGSRENIAHAKSELVQAASDYAVLNWDDPLVAAMAALAPGRVLRVSAAGAREADVVATGIELDAGGRARFRLHLGADTADVELSVVGEHQVGNALAVAAVAWREGLSAPEIATGLAAARPRSRWRMDVTCSTDGVTIVNDAYNANPESVRAALKTVAGLVRARPGARGFAVLGGMHELGAATAAEHDAVGRLAVRLDLHVVAVGELAAPVAAGAAQEGAWGEEAVAVSDVGAALAWLRSHVSAGDVVLVKASRAEGLERLAMELSAGAVAPERGR